MGIANKDKQAQILRNTKIVTSSYRHQSLVTPCDRDEPSPIQNSQDGWVTALPGTGSDRVQILNQISMITDQKFHSPLGIILAESTGGLQSVSPDGLILDYAAGCRWPNASSRLYVDCPV